MRFHFYPRSFFLAASFLFSVQIAVAQRTALGLKLGLSNYQGDLVPTAVNVKMSRLAAGFFLRKNLNERFAVRAGADFGKITGDDALYDDRKTRGYKFSTSIFSASICGQVNFLDRSRFDANGEFKKGFQPYAFTGIGAVVFNPKVEGLGLDAPENDKLGSQSDLLIPFGVGVQYEFSPKVTFGVEAATHLPFTDYLDGVSESAGPGNRDWFGIGTFSVQYWLDEPKRKKATAKPTNF